MRGEDDAIICIDTVQGDAKWKDKLTHTLGQMRQDFMTSGIDKDVRRYIWDRQGRIPSQLG